MLNIIILNNSIMAQIKEIFYKWNENTYDHRHFSNLEYIRSFSVEEFKEFFKVSTIKVKRHPGGFLFFETLRMQDWGLVYPNAVPNNPVISLVVDYYLNLFFLLHERSIYPSSITINSSKYQLSLNRLRSVPLYQSRQEYDKYVRDSYMDAFEGDEDAYWNID